jgi:hypothetical protein
MKADNQFHYTAGTNALLQSCSHYLESEIFIAFILLNAYHVEIPNQ